MTGTMQSIANPETPRAAATARSKPPEAALPVPPPTTDAGSPRVDAQPPSPWREGIAGFIAVTAFVAFLVVLLTSEGDPSDEVIGHLIPIVGTIIGYYFGRAPSEKRANQAAQHAAEVRNVADAALANADVAGRNADQANRAREVSDRALADTRHTLARVEQHLSGSSGVPAGALAAPLPAPTDPRVAMALDELKGLRLRLP